MVEAKEKKTYTAAQQNAMKRAVIAKAVNATKDPNDTPEQQKVKAAANAEKIMTILKAVSAMKLTREDKIPACTVARVNDKLELCEPGESKHGFLYQGSIGAAFNKSALDEAGITHILCCAAKISPRYPEDFKYKMLDLLDCPTQNIHSSFKEAIDFMLEAFNSSPDSKVLVHCFAGKSRASTISLAFMVHHMRIDLKTAYAHLK